MGLFKKKTDYSYYSSYNSKKKLRLGRVAIVSIIGVLLVLGLVVYLNFHRIQFLIKGYSWSTTSEVLHSFDSDEEKELLSHDKMPHILKWVDNSNKVEFYDDYERYYKINKDLKLGLDYEETVDFVDGVLETQKPTLLKYGYTNKDLWDLLKDGAGKKDLQFLISNKLDKESVKPYLKVKGCQLTKMLEYMTKYNEVHDYNYAVNIINYPFIISSNGNPIINYTITDPENLLSLVKKGFFLPSDYEPKDLVSLKKEYVAPTCDHPQLRKEASNQLLKMIKAAEKEDLHILLNSGYRSYEEQSKIYQETEAKYGGVYAAEYVAKPGASEHQTGLGIDLTSQSVVDKQRLVFGDTAEYKWVKEHCAEYGFIIRFAEGTAETTGISHEPWHVRYVGKDVAQLIVDKNWTFEEYCLYESKIPQIKRN